MVNHSIFLNYSSCTNTPNTFGMSFLDNLSQWNMSDKKKEKHERANPTEMKFTTFSHEKRKKKLLKYSFISLING